MIKLQFNKNTFNTSLQDDYLVKVTTEPIGSTSQHVFQIAYLADWGVHRLALADLCEHWHN
jgi:hypothetical protein